jgi:hypothetical protein
MKKTIVTLACCALLAPLAFAQTGSKGTKQATATAEPITVTGTFIKMTTEEGAARQLSAGQNASCSRGPFEYSGQLCSQGAWSRCEQERRSDPNRDQTWHSRACLLHKHGRFACG